MIWDEIRLLVSGVVLGAELMALYDLLRVYRFAVRHSWFWVGMEDLIYWIIAGFAVFYLLYLQNDGALRWFVIATVLSAMAVYDRIISFNFRKLLKKAVKWFKMKEI
ncbi:MAG: spore cortex biosynthesis protein YabQ [Clostridiales bacterium]|nr:spore cortex biosynthesis protein YabQ [Clostridiales bacterium]